MERWKSVKNYEGLYEVSDCGRVRSLPHKTQGRVNCVMTFPSRVLKPQKKRNGYYQVALSKNGHKTWFAIHRLVAEAFLDKQGDNLQVNHKDCDKSNNKVSNLEWCTPQENMLHASKNNKLRGHVTLTQEIADEVKRLHKPYDKEYGTKPLAIKFGIGETTVRDIVHGRRWCNCENN